jgi:hypothetical protein
MKVATKPAPLSIRDAIKRADEAWSRPPLREHIERPTPVGQCVMRFALPLALVQPQNRTHGKTWMLGKLKRECLAVMRAQLPARLALPLPGRPQVLCTRFSSVEPDKYNDSFKVAVDRLVDFGILQDDAPKFVDLHQWWEPAPPKCGFAVIEVWSGKAAGR